MFSFSAHPYPDTDHVGFCLELLLKARHDGRLKRELASVLFSEFAIAFRQKFGGLYGTVHIEALYQQLHVGWDSLLEAKSTPETAHNPALGEVSGSTIDLWRESLSTDLLPPGRSRDMVTVISMGTYSFTDQAGRDSKEAKAGMVRLVLDVQWWITNGTLGGMIGHRAMTPEDCRQYALDIALQEPRAYPTPSEPPSNAEQSQHKRKRAEKQDQAGDESVRPTGESSSQPSSQIAGSRSTDSEILEKVVKDAYRFADEHGMQFCSRVVHWLSRETQNRVIWNAIPSDAAKIAWVEANFGVDFESNA